VGIKDQDQFWMQQALLQAEKAAALNEVPVGAVLVDSNNKLLATGHNKPISSNDPTAHAEICVLRHSSKLKGNYRLLGTTLYVTLEPCVMCVGAMIHARVKRLVYGAVEPKTGAIQSACHLLEDVSFNHNIEITSNVMSESCADILSTFFARRREEKRDLGK